MALSYCSPLPKMKLHRYLPPTAHRDTNLNRHQRTYTVFNKPQETAGFLFV